MTKMIFWQPDPWIVLPETSAVTKVRSVSEPLCCWGAENEGGNVRLSSLVKTCAGEYDCSIGPQIRDTITNRIMAAIKEGDGRCLQQQQSDAM
jgi:hypothetical protein